MQKLASGVHLASQETAGCWAAINLPVCQELEASAWYTFRAKDELRTGFGGFQNLFRSSFGGSGKDRCVFGLLCFQKGPMQTLCESLDRVAFED